MDEAGKKYEGVLNRLINTNIHRVLSSAPSVGLRFPFDPISYALIGDPFKSRYFEPEASPAVENVAKTAWTLWQDRPDRVWNMVSSWTESGSTLEVLNASRTILRTGLIRGYLNSETTLDRLKDWMSEETGRRTLASRLLPELLADMPSKKLTCTLEEWSRAHWAQSLGEIMGKFFALERTRCLSVFYQWARAEDERLDSLLADCFGKLEVPALESVQEYQNLEAAVRNLRLRVGTRNPILTKAVDRFLKSLHQRISSKAGQLPRHLDHHRTHAVRPQSRLEKHRPSRPHKAPG